MDSNIFFYVLLFIVAFLYSSVGHGGASGYLALMAIYGVAPEVMKPTALLLNLICCRHFLHTVLPGEAFQLENISAPCSGIDSHGLYWRHLIDRQSYL